MNRGRGAWRCRRPARAVAATAVATALVLLPGALALAAILVVPDDHATIQAALDVAAPGDTVRVKDGVYNEQVSFPASGSPGAPITLEAFPGHAPILDGTGLERFSTAMVQIVDRSWVAVVGFEIRELRRGRDVSGIRVLGSGTQIEIRDNVIHDIRGKDAMGITVYGTKATSISNLVIDGNEIRDCDPAKSEALTLNGNVELFEVTNNVVRDVNNIGIDLIGGETDVQPNPSLVARNGVVRGNRVERANSIYGGGFAAGIYVDGGRDIVIERNVVTASDLGIEIGAENGGIVASGIVVRDNVLYDNDKACIAFGGYAAGAGRVRDSAFLHNTCHRNDRLRSGFGELWIQYAEDSVVRNNIFHAGAESLLLVSDAPIPGVLLDYNLWFAPAGAGGSRFVWQGDEYASFAAYRVGSGQDADSLFAEAQFFAAAGGDFRAEPGSPAIDAGDPAFVPGAGETDLDGGPRVKGGRVDVGADEFGCGDGIVDAGEACDDSNLVDCDGCDRDCSPSTTCGNRILCLPEECDDGNVVDGDCCSSSCAAAAPGAACDDGDLCTHLDECDGAGACGGSHTPAPVCRGLAPGGGSLLRIVDSPASDRGDKIVWRMNRSEATDLADFGSPEIDTAYALCVYDASAAAQPVLAFSVPAGGECRERPLWKASARGHRHANRCVAREGLHSLGLVRRADASANVKVQGRRERLRISPLALVPPLTVQLRNGAGGCWGTSYASPVANTPSLFKATQ